MDDNTFRIRRRLQPLECRPRRITGYRLRVNLDGRPKGRSAPANLCPDPDAEVWGVLYRITRRDLMLLYTTEGVPGRGYRHIEIEAEDRDGRAVHAATYMARARRSTESPRFGTSRLFVKEHEPTECLKITFGSWTPSSTSNKHFREWDLLIQATKG
jgi:hypothetical protein